VTDPACVGLQHHTFGTFALALHALDRHPGTSWLPNVMSNEEP